MAKVPYIASVVPNDWNSLMRFTRDVQKYIGTLANPETDTYFATLYLTDSTASRLLSTNASQEVVSTDLASWVTGTANEIDITDDADGTITIGLVNPLIVAKGGTGLETLTDGGLLLGSGVGAVTCLAQATDGQLPIGSTGADPVLATLTGTANQLTVTNAAGSITLSTPQDLDLAADFQVQSLLVDQDTNAIGINIDSEATTETNYGLQIVTGAGAGCCYMSYGDGNNGCCYLGLGNNSGYAANFVFNRNLTAASTDSAIVSIHQDHADDDQPCLYLRNDGSGDALYVEAGSISIAAGVTVSTGVTVPDDGYIGSVSEPQAIQIEADGDVVFHQAIDVPSDIVCGGHVLFDLDNGHIGYFDNSPILTFNNADDRTEVTGGLNFPSLTASRLTATDSNKTLASTDLASWVTGTANEINITDDGDGTITLDLDGSIGDIAALTPTDGNFVVGDGANWVAESGNTARTSLGLGTGDSPTLAGLTTSFGQVKFEIQTNIPVLCDGYGAAVNPGYIARRARGTKASPTKVLDGDYLWFIAGRGYIDGTGFQASSSGFVGLIATEDYDDTAHCGTKLEFWSTPTGSGVASIAKRMEIDGSGNTKIGDGGTTNYFNISVTGDVTFNGSAGFYPRVLNQSAEPGAGTGATQCDTGEAVVWTDTDDSKCYLCYNHGGTVKTVELV